MLIKKDITNNKMNTLPNFDSKNRRAYFRMPCDIETDFVYLKTNDLGRFVGAEQHSGCIRDLSGGGIRLITYAEMDINDRIMITMHLDDEVLFLTGDIQAKQSIPQEDYKMKYGIKFVDISDLDQEKIIHYLFIQQRKNNLLATK